MANQWGIPKAVEDEVLRRDKACVYCGAPFGTDRKNMKSWEHIINDVAIFTPDNIALCCIGCNASKGSKLLAEWIASPAATRRGITSETIAPVVKKALSQR